MSENQVLRPEFDLFMRTNSESVTKISEAITKLTEYTIHNDHKHDEVEKRLTNQGQQMTKLTEAVAANTKVTQIAKPIKWIIIIVTTGVLMALGSNLTNNYFSNNKIEQHNGK